jgi:hypothetical protein
MRPEKNGYFRRLEQSRPSAYLAHWPHLISRAGTLPGSLIEYLWLADRLISVRGVAVIGVFDQELDLAHQTGDSSRRALAAAITNGRSSAANCSEREEPSLIGLKTC